MMHRYVIITDNQDELAETKAVMATFPLYEFVGAADTAEGGVDLVLETNPDLVFLEIEPVHQESELSLGFISELHRFMSRPPKVIATAKSSEAALKALRYGVADLLETPFRAFELRRTLLRLDRELVTGTEIADLNPELAESAVVELPIVTIPAAPVAVAYKPAKALTICVKSYGDYRFINADDILYLQADNNSTDIHLKNGEMVTAFKTLKHFENSLNDPFVRIHNSYIINSDCITRIHLGNSVCYLKESLKIPFSKSYKEQVDAILAKISGENYLEV